MNGCGTFTLTKEQKDAIVLAADLAKKNRETRMPTEESAIRALTDAYIRLKDFAWREPMYAPVNEPLDVIEAGSTGIHYATRDDDRRFWIQDEADSWPSDPTLFRLRVPSTEPRPSSTEK